VPALPGGEGHPLRHRPGFALDHPAGPVLAKQVVFLGDVTAWVWELARVNFPGALHILDFFHASEHLERLAEALRGEKTGLANAQWEQWSTALKEQPDGLEIALREARLALPCRCRRRAAALQQIEYVEGNADKLRYAEYQARGLFIGSGVNEAGCKTFIGARCKQAGMFWPEPGAENVLALRCIHSSRRLDAFWQHRFTANAARQDGLPLAA